MKHSVLVTGGAGFIGSHIVDELIKRGNDVRILDNLDPQVHGKDRKNPDYLNQKAKFIGGDVRNRDDLKRALSDVDVVFHEASAVGVGQSMYLIDYYVDVNCRGTGLLLDEIVNGEYDIKKIVVASSMSIYGEGVYECSKCGRIIPDYRQQKQLESHEWEMRCPCCGCEAISTPTPEDKPLRPTSVYAVSKRDQEEMVLSVGKAYGIPSVALRYFNVYGPRQSLSNPYTGVCAIFQSNIKNDNPPVIYEDGLQSRDFIDVRDIVAANMLVLDSRKADYEMFNVGTGKPVTVLHIAETFAKLYGKRIKPEIKNKYRAGDIRHCYADITKIRKIGFKPNVKFEDGMRDLVKWGAKQEAEDRSQDALKELEDRNLVEK
ncbi:MAG: SDR family NAD(P)-dependent oxidoreductase [Candidatus Altiarchaeota archaeon]